MSEIKTDAARRGGYHELSYPISFSLRRDKNDICFLILSCNIINFSVNVLLNHSRKYPYLPHGWLACSRHSDSRAWEKNS